MRLFQTNPKWAALNRGEETDGYPIRKAYVEGRSKGFAVAEAKEISESNK